MYVGTDHRRGIKGDGRYNDKLRASPTTERLRLSRIVCAWVGRGVCLGEDGSEGRMNEQTKG